MRVATKLAIALLSTIALCTKLSAQQTAVIINLTEQTAYLLEDGRVAFVSPMASGKAGWCLPNHGPIPNRRPANTGAFDLYHRTAPWVVPCQPLALGRP
jgi:hypothetical protein